MKHTVSNLVPGKSYAIQARAIVGGRYSEWSNRFDYSVPVPVVPPVAPTGVTNTVSNDSFVVTWNEVTVNSDGGLVANPTYEIEFTNAGTSRIVSIPSFSGATGSYNLTFEQNKTLFGTPRPVIAARVRAVDPTGLSGEWSTSASATNPAPSPVTGLIAVGASDSVMLKWTPPADNDILEYRVNAGTTSGFTPAANNQIYSGTGNSMTYVTTNYSLQFFKVVAVDKFNQSSTVVSASATPTSPFEMDTNPPAAVTNLAVAVTNNPSGVGAIANATWTALTGTDVRGYVLYFREKGLLNWATQSSDSASASIELQKAYTVYEFMVKAEDWANNKSASATVVEAGSATLPVPQAPMGNIVIVRGRDNAALSWQGRPEANISGYSLQIDTVNTFANATPVYVGNTLSYTAGGLLPATTYFIRLRARDAKGQEGAWSNTQSFTTLAQITPGDIGAPTNSEVRDIKADAIRALSEAEIARGNGRTYVQSTAPVFESLTRWSGTVNNSTSELVNNSVVVARNLAKKPSPVNGVGWNSNNGLHWTASSSTFSRRAGTRSRAFETSASANMMMSMYALGSETYEDAPAATAGQAYTVSVYIYHTGQVQNVTGGVNVNWFNQAGATVSGTTYLPTMPIPANQWTRVYGTATAPATATSVRLGVSVGNGVNPVGANIFVYATDAMVTEGSELIPYFDGSSINHVNDIWINTTNSKNTVNRWNGTSWVVATDQNAVDAAVDIAELDATQKVGTVSTDINNRIDAEVESLQTYTDSSISTERVTTNQNISTAMADAVEEMEGFTNTSVANMGATKNTTFVQSAAPSAIRAGDIWIDTTNNSNVIKVASAAGTGSWVVRQDKAIADAATAASTANTAATNAASAASAANTAAATAAGIANSKAVVLYQTTAPAATHQNANTLWIDTTNGANTPKRWSGNAWAAITDKAAIDAASAAAAADTKAVNAAAAAATAQTAANNASTAASTAQTTANGKNTIFVQATAPSATKVGDIWIDTANGNRLKTATAVGTGGWTERKDADITAAQNSATAAATAASNAQTTANTAQTAATNAASAASTAQTAANAANAQALSAAGIADAKGVVLFQNTVPGTTYQNNKTLWIDTTSNANTPKRWNNNAWAVVTDKAATDAATAAAVADGKAVTAKNAADAAQGSANTAITNAAAAMAAANQAVEDAATADGKAVSAMTTANGKNKSIWSTSDASGTAGFVAGDIWFKKNAAGNIIDQWEFAGTAWVKRQLTDNVISSLTVGKLTSGDISAAEINMKSTGAIKSDNYSSGTAGWKLSSNGLEINGGSIKLTAVQNLESTIENSAENAIDEAKSYVQSKGQDLIVNGYGTSGTDENFSLFEFKTDDQPTGTGGRFQYDIMNSLLGDEYIPIDSNKPMKFSFQAKQFGTSTTARFYGGMSQYDAFKQAIAPSHYMYIPNTLTTLAVELKPGDTTVTLANSANWYGSTANPAGGNTHWRSFIWWDYTDAGGKLWAPETYSRNINTNIYDDGALVGNVITLRTAWNGRTIAAGTPVSQGSSGGTYMYSASNPILPNVWTEYTAVVKGTTSGNNAASFGAGWAKATAYARPIWLVNRTAAGAPDTDSKFGLAAVSFTDGHGYAANTTVDSWRTPGTTTINGGSITTDSITAAQIRANSITANKMAVGSTDNLINDPTFSSPLLPEGNANAIGWHSAASVSLVEDAGRTGNALKITSVASQSRATYNSAVGIPCHEGSYFNISFWYKSSVALTIAQAAGIEMGIRFMKTDGTFFFTTVKDSTATTANTWKRVVGNSVAAPAGTVSASVYLQVTGIVPAGDILFDSAFMTRANDGSLIVDGTIEANHLKANAITVGTVSGLQSALDAKSTLAQAQAAATNAANAAEVAAKQYAELQASGAEADAIAAAQADATSKAAAAELAAKNHADAAANSARIAAESNAASAASAQYARAKLLTETWGYPTGTEVNGAYIRTGTLAANQIVVSSTNNTPILSKVATDVAAGTQSAIDAAKLADKISGNGIGKSFHNVSSTTATPGADVAGHVVIDTPITFGNYMAKIHIGGYNYLNNKADIDLSISFYAYATGQAIISSSQSSKGTKEVKATVYRKDSSNTVTLVISAIGLETTAAGRWQHPQIRVDRVDIGWTEAPDSFASGWNLRFETALPTEGYTFKNEPPLYNPASTTSLVNTWTRNTTEIDGGKISTNSIKAKSISVADFMNYAYDGGFTDASQWTVSAGGSVNTTDNYLLMVNTGTTNIHSFYNGVNGRIVAPVKQGDEFYVSYEVLNYAGNLNGAAWVSFPAYSTPTNATAVAWVMPKKISDNTDATVPHTAPNGVWIKVEAVVKFDMPNANYFGISPVVSATGVAADQKRFAFRNLVVRKRNAGELIVDGTIDTKQLKADSITAEKVSSGVFSGKTFEVQTGGVIQSKDYATSASGFKLTQGGIEVKGSPFTVQNVANIPGSGTNLMFNSAGPYGGAGRFLEIRVHQALDAYGPAAWNTDGQPVAMSFDIKVETPASVDIYPYQNTGISIKDTINAFPATTEWQRVELSTLIRRWANPDDFEAGTRTPGGIAFYDRLNATNKISVRNFQIELGTSASPFDLVSVWRHPGSTTINGGFIQTDTISAEQISATAISGKDFIVNDGGSLQSENYNGTAGWRLTADGGLHIANGSLTVGAISGLSTDLSNRPTATAVATSISTAKNEAITTAAADATAKAAAANTAAAAANTAAANAAQAAANAAGIANAKAVVLYQTTAPTAEFRNTNTLWIDTTGGANTPKRWTTGTTWVAITDKAATDAAAAATAADSKAVTAQAAANTAQAAASAAQGDATIAKDKVEDVTVVESGVTKIEGSTIKTGTVEANVLKTSTLSPTAGRTDINIGNNASLVLNGGAIRSNAYGSNVYSASATSGFFISNGHVHIPDGIINAKAIKSGDISGQTITLSSNGKIVGGTSGFELSSSGLTIPDGGIAAKSLAIGSGNNIIRPIHSTFVSDPTVSSYLMNQQTAVTQPMTVTGNIDGRVSRKIYSFRPTAGWAAPGAATGHYLNLFSPTERNNIPVVPGTSYLLSFYVWLPGSVITDHKIKSFAAYHNGTTWVSIAAVEAPSGGANTASNALRRTFRFTVPAGVTMIGLSIGITPDTGTAWGTLNAAIDGVMLESAGANATASPWVAGAGSTLIEAGRITTGELTSSQFGSYSTGFTRYGENYHDPATIVDVTSTEPAWSLNMNGQARLGGASITGNVVLGAPAQTASNVTLTNATSAGTVVTIAGASENIFYLEDIGSLVTGTGIPSGTTITELRGERVAVLSATPTTALNNISIVVARKRSGFSSISSSNYVPGDSGWSIGSDGSAEFRSLAMDSIDGSAIVNGTLSADKISTGELSARVTVSGSISTTEQGRQEFYFKSTTSGKTAIISDEHSTINFPALVGTVVTGPGIPLGTTIVATGWHNADEALLTFSQNLVSATMFTINNKSRVSISSGGLTLLGAGGYEVISLPTDGTSSRFSGAIDTNNLNVRNGLNLSGVNNTLASASMLMLDNGQNLVGPTSWNITPSWAWLMDISDEGIAQENFRNFAFNKVTAGPNQYTFSQTTGEYGGPHINALMTPDGVPSMFPMRLVNILPNAHVNTVIYGYGSNTAGQLVVLYTRGGWWGNYQWEIALLNITTGEDWLETLNTTKPASGVHPMVLAHAYVKNPILGTSATDATQRHTPSMAIRGNEAWIAKMNSAGVITFNRLTATTAGRFGASVATGGNAVQVGTAQTFNLASYGLSAEDLEYSHVKSMEFGNFDYGSERLAVTVVNANKKVSKVFIFSISGTTLTLVDSEVFNTAYSRIEIGGVTWNGANFISAALGDRTLYKHERNIGATSYRVKGRWMDATDSIGTKAGTYQAFIPERRAWATTISTDNWAPENAVYNGQPIVLARLGIYFAPSTNSTPPMKTTTDGGTRRWTWLHSTTWNNGPTVPEPQELPTQSPGIIESVGGTGVLSIRGDGMVQAKVLRAINPEGIAFQSDGQAIINGQLTSSSLDTGAIIATTVTTSKIPLFSGLSTTTAAIPHSVWTPLSYGPFNSDSSSGITRNATAFANGTVTIDGYTAAWPINSVFTVPRDGVYSVSASVRYPVSAGGVGGRGIRVSTDGGTVMSYETATNMMTDASTVVRLSAGERIAVMTYQTSGAAMALHSAEPSNPISIVRLGD